MRIINLTRSLDPKYGGTVGACIAYHKALLEIGYSSELIDIDFLSTVKVKNNYGFSLKSLFRIFTHIKSADYIFVHGLWQFHSLIAMMCCIISGTRLVVFPHGMAATYFDKFKFKKIKKNIYWFFFESFLIRLSQSVVFVGHGELNTTSNYFRLVSNGKEEVIPIPVDLTPNLNKNSNRKDSFINLLFIGRNHPIKGLKPFLSLLDKVVIDCGLNNVVVNVVGDYVYNDFSDICISNFKLNVHGSLFGFDKQMIIEKSDCLIVPSEYESFSLVVLEAVYNNMWALVSNRVGILTDLKCCKNIVEFDFGDYGSLVNGIVYLSNNLGLDLSAANNKDVFNYFSIENVSLKLQRLVEYEN